MNNYFDLAEAEFSMKKYVAQARAISDEFEGKEMPSEALRQMGAHLQKAQGLRLCIEEHRPVYKFNLDAEMMTGDGQRVQATYDSNGGRGMYPSLRGLSEKTVRDVAALIRGTDTKSALVEDVNGDKLVSHDYAGQIVKEMARKAVFRRTATVRPTDKHVVDIGNITITSASWGSLELGDAPADPLGAPDKDSVTVWDLNALAKIGRDQLEDSDEALVSVVTEAITARLAEQEDDAFASGVGDASKQPLGISGDARVTQGLTAVAKGTPTIDDLLKLPYTLPASFREGGAYYAHSSAEQAVTLLKSDDGHYLWQAGDISRARPATFNGRPWYTVDGLPAMTTGAGAGTAPAVFFADMPNGYYIADRRRFTVDILRERFIDQGMIGILATHRVGGRIIRPKAFGFYKL